MKLECGAEEILAELLEMGTGEGGRDVDTAEDQLDLDSGVSDR